MVEKKRSHKKKEQPKTKAKKIPRQMPLPGTEDNKIAAIENLALDYAELRDERVALSAREVDLKQKLIDKMHALGKQEYRRNGVSVKLTVEKEGVKVRVKEEEAPSVEKEDLEVAVSTQGADAAVEGDF
jgi:hypothetical protein